ncbi:MAG: DUF2059 domain-containing protein, partial [Verrucomicrobia bacterium]|nr:DUF2059 domain-containing protein [Verrucomicrobiota bacterium]
VRADEAAARAAAERIFDLVDRSAIIEQQHAATAERVEKDFISRGMPPAGAAEVRKAINDWFGSYYKPADIRSAAAGIYMEEFTEEELKQMVAFYETPVGRKVLMKMSVLISKLTAMAEKFTAGKQNTLTTTIRPILEKYGMTNIVSELTHRKRTSNSPQ